MEYRVWVVQCELASGRVELTVCDAEREAEDLVAFRATCGETAAYWEL